MAAATRFSRILVANRGEIACRVFRTASALGYETVAVYSEADKDAPHVALADQSVLIGPAEVAESYLNVERILDAARHTGADAVHPGYGFLSENAEFAQACTDAGLTFIGPPIEAIRLMGDKAESKRRMIVAGVPCIPGYEGEDQRDEVLLEEAQLIDPPFMVKASAGGGGRGMRIVEDHADLPDVLAIARAEALTAFGSDRLILEKALVHPRHVEVQVFADHAGHTVHLGERDCSVQRRHQKVVEEAPCPVMTPELRQKMGEAAVAAAQSVSYVGAGTVEFLLADDGQFYFLEMNTRLQVEHPVTELVTGLDLVALQILVAQGERLEIDQQDVKLKGHAIEVRLYAEDPANDFLPTSGPIYQWREPVGEGVRVDAGIHSGGAVSPYYDPMVAKIIASGPDREIARQRLIGALRDTLLFGTQTNRDFLIQCLQKPAFIEGQATTSFIAQEFGDGSELIAQPTLKENATAAVLETELEGRRQFERSLGVASTLKNWTSASVYGARKRYGTGGEAVVDLEVMPSGPNCYRVSDGTDSQTLELISLAGDSATVSFEGKRETLRYDQHHDQLFLSIDDRYLVFRDALAVDGEADQGGGDGAIRSPMHGQLVELSVSLGDEVTTGQKLAVVEAMKMFHEITASASGKVKEVFASPGTQVAAEELLVELTLDDD